MNIHLVGAYIVFCGIPLAMAISIELRHRKVLDQIRSLQGQSVAGEKPRKLGNPNG
jgi:hypothetical protein